MQQHALLGRLVHSQWDVWWLVHSLEACFNYPLDYFLLLPFAQQGPCSATALAAFEWSAWRFLACVADSRARSVIASHANDKHHGSNSAHMGTKNHQQ